MNQSEKFMRRALKLARKGGRAVAPNPMVGAVIVRNGRVIGEGWHKKFGGPHAEVNAIRSVNRKADLKSATLYVTLEPCRHWGKTPPCAEAIKESGFARVVAGSRDPFQKGRSETEFLKGKVAEQCRVLNKFFFTWVTKKRPYITVKVAVSADGFVAGPGGKFVRITSPAQDRLVHKLRAAHQAIMVGANTVLSDNPHLGVRLARGPDPLRIILDPTGKTPRTANVYRNKNFIKVATPRGEKINLKVLFKKLARRGISSVMVEPGPTLYRALKKAKLIDELVILKGKKKLKEGLPLAGGPLVLTREIR